MKIGSIDRKEEEERERERERGGGTLITPDFYEVIKSYVCLSFRSTEQLVAFVFVMARCFP